MSRYKEKDRSWFSYWGEIIWGKSVKLLTSLGKSAGIDTYKCVRKAVAHRRTLGPGGCETLSEYTSGRSSQLTEKQNHIFWNLKLKMPYKERIIERLWVHTGAFVCRSWASECGASVRINMYKYMGSYTCACRTDQISWTNLIDRDITGKILRSPLWHSLDVNIHSSFIWRLFSCQYTDFPVNSYSNIRSCLSEWSLWSPFRHHSWWRPFDQLFPIKSSHKHGVSAKHSYMRNLEIK